MKVPCPRCGAETQLGIDNPNRPFCSDRCRNVDLHAWTSDQYRIDADAPATDADGQLQVTGSTDGTLHS